MIYNYVLIDTPNIFNRAFHKNASLEKEVNNSVVIFLSMISKIQKRFSQMGSNTLFYFLFDNNTSKAEIRKEIDPSYKSNRKSGDADFYRLLDLVHLIILNYSPNFLAVQKQGAEADDLVFPLLENLEGNTLLLSNDFDWSRGISDKTHWARYEEDEICIIDAQTFKEVYGFMPSVESICLYKAFRGDKSDNIPVGVPNIREEVLVKLVNSFSSLPDIKDSLYYLDYVSETFRDRIVENYSRLLLNYKLVNHIGLHFVEIESYIYKGDFKPKSLMTMYTSLGLDVKAIDPRLVQFFPKEEKVTAGKFFQFEKVQRA